MTHTVLHHDKLCYFGHRPLKRQSGPRWLCIDNINSAPIEMYRKDPD